MDLRWSEDAQRERKNEDLRSRSTVEAAQRIGASSEVGALRISVFCLSCAPSAHPRGS